MMLSARGLILMLLALATALPMPAFAQDNAELYQAKAIVTGTGETNRAIGFRLCLRDVLMKLSGDQRVVHEPAFEKLLGDAGRYVAEFRYRDRLEGIPIHDEQGTHDRPHDLTCIYKPETLHLVLASLGSRPWLGKRPKLAVFLAVEDTKRRFVLSIDGRESPYMVESFEAASETMAVPIAIPSASYLDSSGAIFEEVHAASPEIWGDATAKVGGDLPLFGSIKWSDDDLGWVAHWRLYFQKRTYSWSVRGVSFDDPSVTRCEVRHRCFRETTSRIRHCRLAAL